MHNNVVDRYLLWRFVMLLPKNAPLCGFDVSREIPHCAERANAGLTIKAKVFLHAGIHVSIAPQVKVRILQYLGSLLGTKYCLR